MTHEPAPPPPAQPVPCGEQLELWAPPPPPAPDPWPPCADTGDCPCEDDASCDADWGDDYPDGAGWRPLILRLTNGEAMYHRGRLREVVTVPSIDGYEPAPVARRPASPP